LQDKHFQHTKKLLFDGETGLQSKKAQSTILKTTGITVYADPAFKRNLAERGVREFKTRLKVYLDTMGRTNFSHLKKKYLFYIIYRSSVYTMEK